MQELARGGAQIGYAVGGKGVQIFLVVAVYFKRQ